MLTVFGLTFLEDAAIKCRATKFTVGNGGSLNEPDTQVSDGTERSLSEVGCPVRVDAPRGIVTAYNISVANIDNIYSESVGVLVYDSTCVTVDHESKIWIVRNGYTVQNGVCISRDSSSGPDDTTTTRSTPTSKPIIDVTDSVVIPNTTCGNYKITMSHVTLLASLISGVLSLALRDF
ncbi:uncharacterized protein LOC124134920 [Haliotis rufescens]|uniref:uncharacterized protein LOC124134920 n=1 Tax=Haliotis rufescens TaxID=6454 RepID=UPI00201ED803|nr:uncharacterized protein LOC124134920 [Haliotis rufescens]